MQLLAAWKDSLTIFKPDNFKVFSLIILNSLVKSYQVWLRYWGWLIPLYFLVYPYPLGIGLIVFLIYVTFFLSVRPSVKIKNYSYFSEYAVRSLYVIIFFGTWILALGSWFSLKVQSGATYTLKFSPGFFIASLFFAVITDFYTLFIFDSRGSVRDAFASIWHAIKMFWFNFPFCFILMVFTDLLVYATSWIPTVEVLSIPITLIINLLILLPLVANIVTNFYVKKVHEQYSIYFGAK